MKNRTNTRWLTQLALLVAVLLVMNYTPLGYLQVGPLSMSLLTIPVAIGAMTLGPVAGAILGGVFGTTSFVSALRTPSVMSAAMLQASPVGTFITCFVARVLVGLCAGWVYIGIKKLLPKNTKLCCAVGAVATPLLNTFWFMLSLCVFFFNTEYVQSLCATFGTTNPFLFVCAFVGVQALIEAVGCGIVATLVTVPAKNRAPAVFCIFRYYSTFKIVPPPITLSPLYSTTAWPGAMARWGAAKSTRTRPSGSRVAVAGRSGWW